MVKQDRRPFSFLSPICFLGMLLFFFVSCNDQHTRIGEKEIVDKPEDINVKAEDIIQGTLKDILQNNKDINDSFKLKNAAILQHLYDENSFQPLWSAKGLFRQWSDSLVTLIDSSRNYGLFPQDYYDTKINDLKNELTRDTSKENKLDAAKWAYSDLLLTSAFVQIVKDIAKGRLLPDSILAKDSSLTPAFFSNQFRQFKNSGIDTFASQLEPQNTAYKNLKQGLKQFLDKANFKDYTFIEVDDSLKLPSLIYKRLSEEDSVLKKDDPDSIGIAAAIKKYQKRKGIKVDGKIS